MSFITAAIIAVATVGFVITKQRSDRAGNGHGRGAAYYGLLVVLVTVSTVLILFGLLG